jgi:hypothetical protein
MFERVPVVLCKVVLDADIRVIDNAHMKSDRLYCQREVGHGVSRDWIKINVKFAVEFEETSEKDVLTKVLEQLRRTCEAAAKQRHCRHRFLCCVPLDTIVSVLAMVGYVRLSIDFVLGFVVLMSVHTLPQV